MKLLEEEQEAEFTRAVVLLSFSASHSTIEKLLRHLRHLRHDFMIGMTTITDWRLQLETAGSWWWMERQRWLDWCGGLSRQPCVRSERMPSTHTERLD